MPIHQVVKISWVLLAVLVGIAIARGPEVQAANKINVLVWDEQQPVRKKVYPNFPGNYIADHLKKNTRLSVTSAKLSDTEQGLSSETLHQTNVLVFWDHHRHRDISIEKSQEMVDLVKEGRLALVALHSAHWSVPFMLAMQERAAQDALQRLPEQDREKATVEFRGTVGWNKPGDYERNFLDVEYHRTADGRITVHVERPNCVFPRCCTPTQPSQIRIVNVDHPIAQGVPKTFSIPETEMYDEPFHIPEPDEVVLDETWQGGEYFRSGCLWNLDKGKVFYFRPGDQKYPIYKEAPILQIIENACLWLGEN